MTHTHDTVCRSLLHPALAPATCIMMAGVNHSAATDSVEYCVYKA